MEETPKKKKTKNKRTFNPVKEMVGNKRAMAVQWSTTTLNVAVKAMQEGKPLVANPFYDNDIKLLKGDLVYARTDEEIKEWIKCKDDIIYFANTYCKLMTPEGVKNITLRDYQVEYLQHLMKHRMSIAFWPRQSSKTTSSAMFMLHYIIFNTDKNALVLGDKGETAREILSKLKNIYLELPLFLKPGIYKWNENFISLDNGCVIRSQNTTEKSGISYTFHCVLADEFAKISPNIQEKFYSHILPTITAAKARFIISSTQNGPELFYRLYTAAENGENEYAPFTVHWSRVPEWDPENRCWVKRTEEWHRQQVANLGSEELFELQYGASFSIMSNTLINGKILNKNKLECFKYIPSSQINTINSQYFLWNPLYEQNLISNLKKDWFIITIDLAEGRGGDYTVFNINKLLSPLADNPRFECVGHYMCNEKDIQDCAKSLYHFCMTYLNPNHYLISIEYNTYGSLFSQYLLDWIYKDDPENFTQDLFIKYYNQDKTRYNIGIRITHRDKLKFCTLFKSDYEKGMIDNKSIVFINELSVFVDTNGNGVYKASFGHDDLVMAQIQVEAVKESFQFKNLYEEFLTMTANGENIGSDGYLMGDDSLWNLDNYDKYSNTKSIYDF